MRNIPSLPGQNVVRKDENISQTVLAGITAQLFSFQVPIKSKMEVTNFANYLDEFDAWGHVTWIFKINGVPFYPYNAIKDQIAFGAPLRELAGVVVSGGDVFSIEVINNYIDPVIIGIAINYEIG